MADVTVNIKDLRSALVHLQATAEPGAKKAVGNMAAVGERAIKLELSRSSHSPGTKTPAKAYADPPSLISGRLRASVRLTRMYQSGSTWVAHVAPTTVYARIQELGGVTGWEHRTHLPPRPYVRPAVKHWASVARDAAIHGFREVTGL